MLGHAPCSSLWLPHGFEERQLVLALGSECLLHLQSKLATEASGNVGHLSVQEQIRLGDLSYALRPQAEGVGEAGLRKPLQ